MVQNRLDKSQQFLSIAATQLNGLSDKGQVTDAIINYKAAVEEQLLSYRPTMEEGKQIEAHAHWAWLHGQLALLEQMLEYITIIPTQTDEASQ